MLLELGGKAPLVVLDDADIDAAVDAAIFGAFMNQGQICMSTERIVVDDSVADAFVGKLAKRARRCRAGTRAGKMSLGALVELAAAERIEALVADARVERREDRRRRQRNGTLMDATVVDHVTPAMRIYTEETFGPVAASIRVKDDEEADPRRQRHGIWPVVGGVQPRRAARAAASPGASRPASATSTAPTVHDEAQMPFGGMKASGYGRFGGKAGIAEFTDLRWITIQPAAALSDSEANAMEQCACLGAATNGRRDHETLIDIGAARGRCADLAAESHPRGAAAGVVAAIGPRGAFAADAESEAQGRLRQPAHRRARRASARRTATCSNSRARRWRQD